jgi:hypothetical protein
MGKLSRMKRYRREARQGQPRPPKEPLGFQPTARGCRGCGASIDPNPLASPYCRYCLMKG